MKKKIIITAGPTNERIDSVMKITNMSTGALGSIIADTILSEKEEEIDTLFYLSSKLTYKPSMKSQKLELVSTESTKDLLETLKSLLRTQKIDTVIHSAAVGDYYGEYTVTGEMLAKEIAFNVVNSNLTKEDLQKLILSIIEKPAIFVENGGKISSYEKNLIVKLGLTPKVISCIKEESPTTKLIGFKLLDSVAEVELLQVARNLLNKNQADYIVANDLSKIGNGKHHAYIIDRKGAYDTCETKKEIAKILTKKIFEN